MGKRLSRNNFFYKCIPFPFAPPPPSLQYLGFPLIYTEKNNNHKAPEWMNSVSVLQLWSFSPSAQTKLHITLPALLVLSVGAISHGHKNNCRWCWVSLLPCSGLFPMLTLLTQDWVFFCCCFFLLTWFPVQNIWKLMSYEIANLHWRHLA